MAVYYKFKSARDYDSIALDGPFISVGTLKEKIFESKHLGRGTDFDLVVTNAQTNEEYLDEAMLIPKNTSVLIRRVPGRPRMPIVTQQEPKLEDRVEEMEAEKTSVLVPDSSVMRYTEDWDEFGNDLYAIPEVLPAQSSNPILDAPPTNKADEDSKIKALIDTSALDWTRGSEGFGSGRGFGRGPGGRMGGRGFGFEKRTPPPGYVCHRCKVPGHFIQHCPTNGDPNYDVKRVKPPTGIPKSMLMATPDGSYALPSGAVAVLKPNEAAFEKEIEGLPSTRSVGDLPPELHCPLCKEVMKDAVLTSRCCFKSFCDKCIRNHIISKSACVCGATNILADDLLPNKTLRDAINRILESGNSSAENAGSFFQIQDMESARSQPKAPSPTLSAASNGKQKQFLPNEEASKTKVTEEEGKALVGQQVMFQKARNSKVVDASEATHESMSVKEAASQGSAPLTEEEVQQRLAAGEAGKTKKKKKVRPPGDVLWKTPQDLALENYLMHMGPSPYNPYWTGIQPGLDGYMAQYTAPMPYLGYGLGPLDMGFGGVMPPDPYAAQGYMYPHPVVPPQRDLADFGMGMNVAPPMMGREEFEARKVDSRMKHDNDRRFESKEHFKDRDYGREMSGGANVTSTRPKHKSVSQTPSADPHRHSRLRSKRSPDPPRPPKRNSEHRHHESPGEDQHRRQRTESSVQLPSETTIKSEHRHYDNPGEDKHRHQRSESSVQPPSETTIKSGSTTSGPDQKHKSVFSRISYPENEVPKKQKISSVAEAAAGGKTSSNGYYNDYKSKGGSTTAADCSRGRSSTAVGYGHEDHESSDEDRHFKRKPKRYEPSDRDREEIRQSRGSRDRSSYEKHNR